MAMRYLLLLATLPILTGATASLAPVDWQSNPGEHIVTVRLEGKIMSGDVERIRTAMIRAKNTNKAVIALELVSWGGDADAGLAIARYVYKNNINVLLSDDCWSACGYAAMVALGRGNLMIRGSGNIGLHQVWDNVTGLSDKNWTEGAARTLSKMSAPKNMLKDMVATSSDGMTQYSFGKLRDMGALVINDDTWWWPLW
jgi:hypothetical protein